MDASVALLVAIGTSLFWLWLVARHDDHEREPWWLVAIAAGLGAAVTTGVTWARPLLADWLEPLTPVREAFLLTALAEEAWKALAFLPLLCLRELDEPLDGAIYGVAVGLGFATVENLHYARMHDDLGLLLQRSATATLLHAASSGCLGLCFAEGKLRRLGLGTPTWLALGAVIAVGGHGCYDLFLAGDHAQALVSLLVVLPVAVALLAFKIHWARSRSHHFHP